MNPTIGPWFLYGFLILLVVIFLAASFWPSASDDNGTQDGPGVRERTG